MSHSPRLQDWVEKLYKVHQYRVDLTLTRNRRSMISLRQVGWRHATLRLHWAFDQAPETVLDDLETFILSQDGAAWKRVATFARKIPAEPRSKSRPLPTVPGRHFDLEAELAFIKTTYFEQPPEASIAWGKAGAPRRRKRRSIRFGSWHADCKQVRIHPLLDQDWVPQAFMRYLIYHELCHAVAPPYTDVAGRHHIHHREFKALEKQFPDLKEMEKLSTQIFKKLVKMKM